MSLYRSPDTVIHSHIIRIICCRYRSKVSGFNTCLDYSYPTDCCVVHIRDRFSVWKLSLYQHCAAAYVMSFTWWYSCSEFTICEVLLMGIITWHDLLISFALFIVNLWTCLVLWVCWAFSCQLVTSCCCHLHAALSGVSYFMCACIISANKEVIKCLWFYHFTLR